jgi:hypothetical protein
MKIRLMGPPAEVSQAVKVLRAVETLDITEISSPYSNRRRAPRNDACYDCGVFPGGLHTPRCGARDSGQEIWSGYFSHGTSCMIRVYIEAQLRADGRADP